MPLRRRFTPADYVRMAKELDAMADMIHEHPEMNHHTTERLKRIAGEMRGDATTEDQKLHASV
jgi:hypothetical protein